MKKDIAELKNQGKEVIVVTSGAVGFGAKKLNIPKPDTIETKQACAAIGQAKLMHFYEDAFDKFNITVVTNDFKGTLYSKCNDFTKK